MCFRDIFMVTPGVLKGRVHSVPNPRPRTQAGVLAVHN